MILKSIDEVRSQFPFLERKVNNYPLIYFDNAATTQKPKMVLDAMLDYQINFNANVHRGVHTVSQEATLLMENSRKKIQKFINAKHDHEIIFTKGTTEGINIVSHSFRNILKKDDEILISYLEHHSNIVPWQILCQQTGAKLKVIPIDLEGVLDLSAFEKLLSEKTKIVSVTHISNALGIINPIEFIIKKSHEFGALVLIDAAQSIAHKKIDVQLLDADFLVFSGHKIFAPTGTGVLYGKEKILNSLPPFHGGGEMIESVSFEKTTYAPLPFKFEAGTPNFLGNTLLGTAIDFVNSIDTDFLKSHEEELLSYATLELSKINEIIIYAKDSNRANVISFNLNLPGVSAFDVGMFLDKYGVAIRTGQHCTQPIMDFLKIQGTARASFSIYNSKSEIDNFIEFLKKTIKFLF
ncbi:MAG: aminotransferase class V-fold PLP-dependent enzyme [Solirubrobacteraceae bacterium]